MVDFATNVVVGTIVAVAAISVSDLIERFRKRKAISHGLPQIEYRVLWTERIGDRDIQFSGKVQTDFAEVHRDAAYTKGLPHVSALCIEAREASEGEWARPGDDTEGDPRA